MKLKKHVILAGGSGLIGKNVIKFLDPNLFHITILSRKTRPSNGQVHFALWDPTNRFIDPSLPDADIIINLSGEGIADKRWTSSRKKELVQSRLESVETLSYWISTRKHKPKLFIGASAIGFYGDRGNEILTEDSAPGKEYLSDQCVQWEGAYRTLTPLVDRMVLLRIGIVLSMEGGALPEMLMTKPFRFLTYFGSGNQYFPWIHMKDLCRIIVEAIHSPSWSGVMNAVAPDQISNKTAVSEIQKVLGGWYLVLPVPTLVLKIILGEMSRVVLNSNRVVPNALQANGFVFGFTNIAEAIRDLFQMKNHKE